LEFLTQVLHEACQSALCVAFTVWWSMKCSSSSASRPGGQPLTVVAVMEPSRMTGSKSLGISVMLGFAGFARLPEEGEAF